MTSQVLGGGEFTLRLIPHQKVAPLYWRSDTHTHTMVTAQVVLKLARSCVGAKIASKVDAVAAQELFVLDLVDVFQVDGWRDVNLALVDKVSKIILVDLSLGHFRGVIGHGQMRPDNL